MIKTFSIASLSAIAILAGGLALAQDKPPREEPAQEAQMVTLLRRTGNGAYGQSAYSFRQATFKVSEHRNYVDLVFDACGGLHVTPYGGVTSRIVDLGRGDLADGPAAAPADAKWGDFAAPKSGHVYLQEIVADGQRMTVRVRVEKLTAQDIRLTWVVVKPLEGRIPEGARGEAGTMGNCAASHEAKDEG